MTLKVFTGEDTKIIEAPSTRDRAAARRMVDAYIKQVADNRPHLISEIDPKEFDAGQKILEAPPGQQVAVVVEAAIRLAKHATSDFERVFPLRSLLSSLLRRNLPFDESSADGLIQAVSASGWWEMPLGGVLRVIERCVDQFGMSAAVRRSLEFMHGTCHSDADYAEERRIGKRIDSPICSIL